MESTTASTKVRLRDMFSKYITTPLIAAFRWTVPKVVLTAIVLVWAATVKHDVSVDRFIVEFIFVALLLAILFYAEALEIAYTVLSDKNDDEFPESDRETIKEMKARTDLVYEAREWLVIAIVVIITLATEFDTIYFPFVGAVPNLVLPILYGGKFLTISSAHVFSILFTTLPIIWFAQGPAKTVGLLASQTTIRRSKKVWWIIKKVGALINFAGLNKPAEFVGKELLKQSFNATTTLSPSDKGFFFSALQRYGFALHNLSVTIRLHNEGCTVTQKFALYLVRYPRSSFFRQLYFPNAKAAPPDSFSVKGYECDLVGQNYEDLCTFFEQLHAGKLPASTRVPTPEAWAKSSLALNKEGNLTGKTFAEEAPAGVRYGVTMDRPLPPKGIGGFAFLVEMSGNWEGEAFFVKHMQDDYFEMRFDYPCRAYELRILKEEGLGIYYRGVTAEATLMDNPHKGETDRLDEAVRPNADAETLLHAVLPHPLPGAKYKLKWQVRAGNGA